MYRQYSVSEFKEIRGHDGRGYEATLCLNGKPVAHIFDDGRGGDIECDWVMHDYKMYEQDLADATRQWFDTQEEDYDLSLSWCCVEMFIGHLCDEFVARKWIRKKGLTHIMYQTETDDQWYGVRRFHKVSNKANCAAEEIEVINMLTKKYGNKLTRVAGLRSRPDIPHVSDAS